MKRKILFSGNGCNFFNRIDDSMRILHDSEETKIEKRYERYEPEEHFQPRESYSS
jgi:hypothetical protein